MSEATQQKTGGHMTLTEYALLALNRGARCWNCDEPLSVRELRYWEHSEGWEVEGFSELQWLYFECPKCKYQTSFDVLRIKRPRPK